MEQIKNCRVLIVDDDPSVREVLESSLELFYSNVSTVESGESAIEYFQSNDVDLALLDINMSGMSGLELLKWIQTNRSHVTCVIVSSTKERDLIRQAVKLRAFDFIEKPFTIEQLQESCEQALIRQEQERQEAERELLELFNSTENGMWVLDVENTVTRVNASFLKAFGFVKEQVIGKKCYEIWENHHCSSLQSSAAKVWTGAPTGATELRLEVGKGKQATFVVKMAPYVINGQQIGLICNFIDITQVKMEELEKEQYMKRIDEQNAALRVLLKEVDREKLEIKKTIVANIDSEVRHQIHRIEELAKDQGELLEEIKQLKFSIEAICDDFYRELGMLGHNLSPTELKVCKMFKEGLARKEIAGQLCVSEGTVKSHSTNIRKKLGINNSGVTLSTFLNNFNRES